MKKKFEFGMLAATTLLMTGCANEEPFNGVETDGTVTFELTAPAMLQTRAIGEGETANDLRIVVFKESGEYVLTETQKDIVFDENNRAKVTINLVKGESYKLAFWLDTELAYDITNGVISMGYNENNDDSRDAFYATAKVTVGQTYNQSVTLHRPFAQINLGTNDFTLATTSLKKDFSQSSVKISGIYGQMNLIDGTVEGNALRDVEFSKTAHPTEVLKVSDKDYTWLSMCYVLVDEKGSTVDVSATLYDASGNKSYNNALDFTSVPAKRNHRTNIVGALLTDGTDWDINVDTDFATPDLPELWDGSTKEVTPKSTTIDGNTVYLYSITSAAELAWVAENVKAADAYIQLTENLDLNNVAFPGFGTDDRKASESEMFNGVFDGNGKTISNLKVDCNTDNHGSGLIRTANNATVKNVTIKNVTMTSDDFMGGVVGFCLGTTTIENCHVVNCNLNSYDTAGGILGKDYGETTVIKDCTVSGFISGQKAGGILSHAASGINGVVEFNNCVNNATVVGIPDAAYNYKWSAGGMCAYSGKGVTIKNCVNNGNVGSSNVGWVASMVGYYSALQQPSDWVSEISGNTNNAKITAGSKATVMINVVNGNGFVTLKNNTNTKNGSKLDEWYKNDCPVTVSSTGYTDNSL